MTNDNLIVIISQGGCRPCERLKAVIDTYPPDYQSALTVVPLRAAYGGYNPFLAELGLQNALTPTMVVVKAVQGSEVNECGEEIPNVHYEQLEEPVVGGKAITAVLRQTIEAYKQFPSHGQEETRKGECY